MRRYSRCRRVISVLWAVLRQRRLGTTFLASPDTPPQPRLGSVTLWGAPPWRAHPALIAVAQVVGIDLRRDHPDPAGHSWDQYIDGVRWVVRTHVDDRRPDWVDYEASPRDHDRPILGFSTSDGVFRMRIDPLPTTVSVSLPGRRLADVTGGMLARDVRIGAVNDLGTCTEIVCGSVPYRVIPKRVRPIPTTPASLPSPSS